MVTLLIPPIKMVMTGDGLWHCFYHIVQYIDPSQKEKIAESAET